MFGGGIIFNNNQNKNINDTLNDILNDNSTVITNMNTKSIGGYLFNLTMDAKYRSLFSSLTSSGFAEVNDMILKVVIISDNNSMQNTMYDDHEIVTQDTFNAECEMQTLIHNMSYDKFLESICPTIISKKIVEDSSNLTANNEAIALMRNLLKSKFKVGLIFMEKLNSKNVSQVFDQNSLIQHLNSPTVVTNKIKHVLDNYLYELCRLWRLGYVHGDTHLSNAMYLDDYDYINNERVYLIDFGRSTQHKQNILDNSLMDKKICTDIDWPSYKPLQIYKTTIDNFGVWFENMLNHRKESQMSFLQKLNVDDKILLTNIRKYEYNSFDEYKTSPNATNGYYDFNTYTAYIDNVIDVPFIKDNEEYAIIKDKMMNVKNNVVYTIINGLKENQDYYDINITRPTNNVADVPEGIYVWVLYYQDNGLKISFLRTMSYYEIGSKHYCLMMKNQITYYYSAGEMRREGDTFHFNFLSGTYMWSIMQKNRQHYDTLLNVSMSMIGSLNQNVLFNFDGISFITPNLPMYPKLFTYLQANNLIIETKNLMDVVSGGRVSIAPSLLNTHNLQKIYDKSNNHTNDKFDSSYAKVANMSTQQKFEQPKVNQLSVEPNVEDTSAQNVSFEKTLEYYKTANDIFENAEDQEINKFFVDNFKNDIFRENIDQMEKNLLLMKKNQFEVLNNDAKLQFNQENNNTTGGLMKNKKKRKTKKNKKMNIKNLKSRRMTHNSQSVM